MTTEYDRLTLRSIEAKQRLDEAEQSYQRALNGVDGVLWSARVRRDVALKKYLAIEAERKRAAAPPAPVAGTGPPQRLGEGAGGLQGGIERAVARLSRAIDRHQFRRRR